jgi:hypothetical protein
MTNTIAPYTIRANHSTECIGNIPPMGFVGYYSCTDSAHCRLIAAQNKAANEYEAFLDGAIFPARTSAEIEQRRYALSRDYDRTSAALIAYRRTLGN